jgi:hypothetical protein
MDNLIKNLRNLAAFAHGDVSFADEAADEIERLRAENERLREALEKIIHEDLWTTKHPDGVTQRGESVFDGYFGGIARAALEGKDEK